MGGGGGGIMHAFPIDKGKPLSLRKLICNTPFINRSFCCSLMTFLLICMRLYQQAIKAKQKQILVKKIK